MALAMFFASSLSGGGTDRGDRHSPPAPGAKADAGWIRRKKAAGYTDKAYRGSKSDVRRIKRAHQAAPKGDRTGSNTVRLTPQERIDNASSKLTTHRAEQKEQMEKKQMEEAGEEKALMSKIFKTGKGEPPLMASKPLSEGYTMPLVPKEYGEEDDPFYTT